MIPKILPVAALAVSFVIAPPVQAADDDSSTSVRTCKRGLVFDRRKNKCVRASSQVLPDGELVKQAWQLVRNGDYQQAIDTFELVSLKDSPKVLNGLGYSNRKLGKIDVGITYYRRALAIDPDYVLARSYLGEGYVSLGRMDLALEQLGEIEKRCGTGCREYGILAEAIKGA